MNFKNNKLSNDLIREILLFSKSREEIIEKNILKKASKEYVCHNILFNYDNNIYFFKTNKIYNPLTQRLISTQNLKFNNRANILNYISACGYKLRQPQSLYAFIYIPQDIMIKEYLMEK